MPGEPGNNTLTNIASHRDIKNFVTKTLILNSSSGVDFSSKKQSIDLVRPREFILHHDTLPGSHNMAFTTLSPRRT